MEGIEKLVQEAAEQVVHDTFPSMDSQCSLRYVEQATRALRSLAHKVREQTLADKESGCIEHIGTAVEDGCVCGLCSAVRTIQGKTRETTLEEAAQVVESKKLPEVNEGEPQQEEALVELVHSITRHAIAAELRSMKGE